MTTDNPTLTKGCSAEILVALRFAERGHIVSFPLRTCSYDLVVDDGVRLWKVQVKQGNWLKQNELRLGKGDRERWMVSLEYKGAKRGGGSKRRLRGDDEFDWLAVVCRPDRVYVVPVERLQDHQQPGKLRKAIWIKEEVGEDARADSKAAAERWLPYLNNFALDLDE